MSELNRFEKASKLVAETYYGERGLWLCNAFEAINKELFSGKLPYPHIVLTLTAHGRCLAWCSSSERRPPTIALHPSLFGGTEKEDPWNLPPEWFGKRFAFDTLVHECMHVAVNYLMGGSTGPTSHNNPEWVGEVNRLAPLMGFRNVEAGLSKTKRVPIEGEFTKTGKPKTKVERVSEGNIPFAVAAGFPQALRIHRGKAGSFYRRGKLPVEVSA